MVGALLLAAGKGNRMQGKVEDKLLHPIGNSNAFMLSCQAFWLTNEVDSLVIVYKDETQLAKLKGFLEQLSDKCPQSKKKAIYWAQGGQERQDSVWTGLCKFPEEITHVLVHDCARPFIRPKTISQAIEQILLDRAITVARPLKDTLRQRIKHSTNPISPSPTRTLDRTNQWLMETPQGAPRGWLVEGINQARTAGILITDDMAAIELIGLPIGMLEPDYPNPKITTPEDFSYAEFLLKS